MTNKRSRRSRSSGRRQSVPVGRAPVGRRRFCGGFETMITLDTIRDAIPDYARDLRLNLGSVLTTSGAPGLSEKQIWAVALAAAIASRNAELTRDIEALAGTHLDAAYVNGARAAAAV